MKTKTIEQTLILLDDLQHFFRAVYGEKQKPNQDALCLIRNNILQEKQRKEQKKFGFKLYRHKGLMEMHLPANSIVEDKGDGIFEITVNHKDTQPYSITSTGEVIINDGEKFDELFAKLAQAYLKKINIPSLIIVSDKCK